MELLPLLKDLAAIREAVWIVGYEGGVVSENTPEGMREPVEERGSITVQAASWHFHLNASLVTEAHITEQPDMAHGQPNQLSRRVRLAGPGGKSPLRIYVQSPEAFANLCATWQAREGVRVERKG